MLLSCHVFIAVGYKLSLLTLPLCPSCSPCTPPTLAHIWQTLWRRKWNGVEAEHERGGHLAASALTSTRLAGVINRWLASGGGHGVVKKRWDKDVRWQARLWGVAVNKYSHMAHTNTLSSYVVNFFAQPSCHPSAQRWYNLSGGGANTGIRFRDETSCWQHTAVAFEGPTHSSEKLLHFIYKGHEVTYGISVNYGRI